MRFSAKPVSEALRSIARERVADSEPATVVVFRVFKDGGDVVALFPNDDWDHLGHCGSYQHVGQHGAASYSGVISDSRPARPEEYADLKRELESIGYHLKVAKRHRRRG